MQDCPNHDQAESVTTSGQRAVRESALCLFLVGVFNCPQETLQRSLLAISNVEMVAALSPRP